MTKSVALLVEYDGTAFHGYQRLDAAREPTIQGSLEKALLRLCGTPVSVAAAGRTDAGVHATGQVISFKAPGPERFTTADWQRALNAMVPSGIAIRQAVFVDDTFSARYSALGRTYRYRVFTDPVRAPLRERYTYRIKSQLDSEAMQRACMILAGYRDFGAFGQSPANQKGKPRRHTVRELRRADIRQVQDELWLEFEANAFLRGMVRRMVGTLLMVGQHAMTEAMFSSIVEQHASDHVGVSAPPQGLYLIAVQYPPGTVTWPAEQHHGEGYDHL